IESASTDVTLTITNGNGSDSGLKTTNGTEIDLFLEGNGVVTGRTGGSDGEVAFAISIDNNGVVTVALYESLQHPDSPDNFDESVNLAGKLAATVRVTDFDGDVPTASTDIGAAISFKEDGPSASIQAV